MYHSEISCTSPEIKEAPKGVASDLVPSKSSGIYKAKYEKFIMWCESKHVKTYSENVLLAYFSELATTQKMKSPTLWSQYSMIKSLLNIKHGLDISKYLKLRTYLKKQNEGYAPKKTKVFTKEQFERFVFEAPDEKYLGMKVILIIGISGACRCDELVKMKTKDIQDFGSLLLIKIPDGIMKKGRSFTVIGEKFVNFYRKYAALRPEGMNDSRFLLKYINGKCHRSVMGIHTIGNIGRAVASYLKLENWKEYTGHCLRRTSATLLVDGGVDVTCWKRNGGWKPNCAAESYVEESLTNDTLNILPADIKTEVPEASNSNENDEESSVGCRDDLVLEGSLNEELNSVITTSSSGLNFQNASVNNCTFNVYRNVADAGGEESMTKEQIDLKMFSPNIKTEMPEADNSNKNDEESSSVGSRDDLVLDGFLNSDLNSVMTSSGFNFQNASINGCTFNVYLKK